MMPENSYFTNNLEVASAIRDIEQLKRPFSDIIDDHGHQYVDIVLEGGGVLGIALVGYIYALEKAGIRFRNIAGTSAGSIVALTLAALDSPAAAKGERLVEIIASAPFNNFKDGDQDANEFIDSAIARKGILKLAWKGIQVVDNLKEDLGLCQGDEFEKWQANVLAEFGIENVKALQGRLEHNYMLRPGRSEPFISSSGRLAMIAADVTTGLKVEFPRMAYLYFGESVNPAKFARASMSVPFFFKPCRAEECSQEIKAWAPYIHGLSECPRTALFIDGGILSNFPIDLFHAPEKVPFAPTFGVKLGVDRKYRDISSPGALLGAIFDTARGDLDRDFILKNPDYRHLVTEIPTGNHDWLNFDLSLEDQNDLFSRGVISALSFLHAFNWAEYKNIRRSLAKVHLESGSNVT
jgi:NTE family protein